MDYQIKRERANRAGFLIVALLPSGRKHTICHVAYWEGGYYCDLPTPNRFTTITDCKKRAQGYMDTIIREFGEGAPLA